MLLQLQRRKSHQPNVDQSILSQSNLSGHCQDLRFGECPLGDQPSARLGNDLTKGKMPAAKSLHEASLPHTTRYFNVEHKKPNLISLRSPNHPLRRTWQSGTGPPDEGLRRLLRAYRQRGRSIFAAVPIVPLLCNMYPTMSASYMPLAGHLSTDCPWFFLFIYMPGSGPWFIACLYCRIFTVCLATPFSDLQSPWFFNTNIKKLHDCTGLWKSASIMKLIRHAVTVLAWLQGQRLSISYAQRLT